MIVVLSFLDYGSLLRPVGRLHVKSNAAGGFLDDLMPRWLSSWFHINQSRGNRYGGKIQSLHRGFNFHAVRISHQFFFGVPYMKPIIPHQSPNDTYSILDGPLSQVLALLLECSQPMLAKEPIPSEQCGLGSRHIARPIPVISCSKRTHVLDRNKCWSGGSIVLTQKPFTWSWTQITVYSTWYGIWIIKHVWCMGSLLGGHHVLQHNAAPSASASMARTAMDCKSDSDDDDFLSELLTCHRSVLWISFTMIHPSS